MNFYKLHYDRKAAVIPANDEIDAQKQFKKYNGHLIIHRLELTDHNNFVQDIAGKKPDIWQAIAIARAINNDKNIGGGNDV